MNLQAIYTGNSQQRIPSDSRHRSWYFEIFFLLTSHTILFCLFGFFCPTQVFSSEGLQI